MKTDPEKLAFRFLFIVGLFTITWGLFGPLATGSNFSSAVVEELELPREPDTYTKIAEMYARTMRRQFNVFVVLGILVIIPSVWGIWKNDGKSRMEHS